ncbi:Leucine-rich repeat containing protein [Entamoeba marina]
MNEHEWHDCITSIKETTYKIKEIEKEIEFFPNIETLCMKFNELEQRQELLKEYECIRISKLIYSTQPLLYIIKDQLIEINVLIKKNEIIDFSQFKHLQKCRISLFFWINSIGSMDLEFIKALNHYNIERFVVKANKRVITSILECDQISKCIQCCSDEWINDKRVIVLADTFPLPVYKKTFEDIMELYYPYSIQTSAIVIDDITIDLSKYTQLLSISIPQKSNKLHIIYPSSIRVLDTNETSKDLPHLKGLILSESSSVAEISKEVTYMKVIQTKEYNIKEKNMIKHVELTKTPLLQMNLLTQITNLCLTECDVSTSFISLSCLMKLTLHSCSFHSNLNTLCPSSLNCLIVSHSHIPSLPPYLTSLRFDSILCSPTFLQQLLTNSTINKMSIDTSISLDYLPSSLTRLSLKLFNETSINLSHLSLLHILGLCRCDNINLILPHTLTDLYVQRSSPTITSNSLQSVFLESCTNFNYTNLPTTLRVLESIPFTPCTLPLNQYPC